MAGRQGVGGRPRKPVAIKQLEGSRIRPPDKDAAEWEVAADVPRPPKHLDLVAQAEWKRLAPEMHSKGLLPDASLSAFESYCSAHSKEREALLNGDDSKAIRWQDQKLKYMTQFGLTPATAGKVTQRKQAEAEDPAAAWMKKA